MIYRFKTENNYWRLVDDDRLKSDARWWASSRLANIRPEYYQRSLAGAIRGEMEGYESWNNVMAAYVDKNLPVLDAGCGDAQLLVGLCKNQYNAQGIELETEVVARIKELFPVLPIKAGDALAIDSPDGYYGTYISLGVVEHRKQGPLPFLFEARRVLTPGGIMLISVPYINIIRRMKAWFKCYQRQHSISDNFYQYYFSVKEFNKILSTAGFKVMDKREYGLGYALVRSDLPGLAKFYDKHKLFYNFIRWAGKTFKYRNGFGHMMLFVCQKL